MALVQFSHANGFPAGSYRTFFDYLAPTLEVQAIERIGMDPEFPVTDCWPHLVAQLEAEIEKAKEPPVLVGHSLGGMLSMQAAYSGRVRVRAVVMIDAPVIAGWRARLLQLAKLLRLDARYSPAGQTVTRRERWASRAEARTHFQSRRLFDDFDPRALNDYVNAGLIEDGAGVKLAIDRAIETRIYRTIPHHLYRLARRDQPVPFGFLAGTRSRELVQAGPLCSRHFVGPYFRWFEGGHLLPMERPEEAARALIALLADMGVLERAKEDLRRSGERRDFA
jgi:pimeloyl-ACP methyl ester carboxylesterase